MLFLGFYDTVGPMETIKVFERNKAKKHFGAANNGYVTPPYEIQYFITGGNKLPDVEPIANGNADNAYLAKLVIRNGGAINRNIDEKTRFDIKHNCLKHIHAKYPQITQPGNMDIDFIYNRKMVLNEVVITEK